jgi:hypothetical protein
MNTFHSSIRDINSCIYIYAAGTYHFCVLQQHGMEALFKWGNTLEIYLKEFDYQLSQISIITASFSDTLLDVNHPHHIIRCILPNALKNYHHLNSIGYTYYYYAMEWFTTSYILNIPHSIYTYVQDMLMHHSQICNNILINIGILIMAHLPYDIISSWKGI